MNQIIVEQKICCCVIIVLYAFERNKYTHAYVLRNLRPCEYMPGSVFFMYLFFIRETMQFGWCCMKRNSTRALGSVAKKKTRQM